MPNHPGEEERAVQEREMSGLQQFCYAISLPNAPEGEVLILFIPVFVSDYLFLLNRLPIQLHP